MRLILTSFLTLDGVYQGPGSPDEDRSDGFERGGWLVPFVDATFEEQATAWTASATAFLFGHRTYGAFAAVWPTITNPADRNAAQLNSRPKFVAATTPVERSWTPVTVLDQDLEAQISALKDSGDGELQVHGSGRLGRTLLAVGLVDELRLVIAPVILGQGRQLFGDTAGPLGFQLLSSQTTSTGLQLCRYGFKGAAGAGAYVRGVTERTFETAAEGSR